MKTCLRSFLPAKRLLFQKGRDCLCFLLLLCAVVSCGEKEKPPDFKKDTSATILFKKTPSQWKVSVEKVLRSSFQHFIVSTGSVAAGTKYPVKSLLKGRISHLSVEEGQHVKQGEVIGGLDQKLILLNLQYQAAVVEYQKARIENLRESGDQESPEIKELVHLLQAEETRQEILENRLENTRFKSPIAGRILRLFVQPGEVISQGTLIAKVVDLSRITIRAGIAQRDLPFLKKGIRVEVRLSEDSRQIFLGEVTRVALEADPKTHRFGVEVSLVNFEEKFMPGMTARIKVRGAFLKDVLSVPKSAVKKQEGETIVFVLKDSHAESRKIILGPEQEEKWVVRSGIKEGEQVITSEVNRIADGDSVEAITIEK